MKKTNAARYVHFLTERDDDNDNPDANLFCIASTEALPSELVHKPCTLAATPCLSPYAND
jgi:hypothetical protein